MEHTQKAYIVTEYGGYYDDSWTNTIAVCLNKETAKKIVKENEDRHNRSTIITENEWIDMCDKVFDYEQENNMTFCSTIEGLIKLFGTDKYSEEEYRIAEYKYDKCDDYCYTDIQEVAFYND